MTNYDLEYFYELLSEIRFKPDNTSNILCLKALVEAVGCNNTTSVMTEDLKAHIAAYMKLSYYISDHHLFGFLNSPQIIIEDKLVIDFFRKYFLELLYLCETERYQRVFCLIDKLDNMPEYIVNNNLKLPIKKLKACLRSYWKKYDKSFLYEFIKLNN